LIKFQHTIENHRQNVQRERFSDPIDYYEDEEIEEEVFLEKSLGLQRKRREKLVVVITVTDAEAYPCERRSVTKAAAARTCRAPGEASSAKGTLCH
ncbi:hypothetical protein ANCCAN_18273, partial [Ancylostoma caninum]